VVESNKRPSGKMASASTFSAETPLAATVKPTSLPSK
jgi:hypothetical protein